MNFIIVFVIRRKKTSNEKDCQLCQILLIFCDFEKDLKNNMFNKNFLWEYHSKLIFHLQKMNKLKWTNQCCAAFKTMGFIIVGGTGTRERHGTSP